MAATFCLCSVTFLKKSIRFRAVVPPHGALETRLIPSMSLSSVSGVVVASGITYSLDRLIGSPRSRIDEMISGNGWITDRYFQVLLTLTHAAFLLERRDSLNSWRFNAGFKTTRPFVGEHSGKKRTDASSPSFSSLLRMRLKLSIVAADEKSMELTLGGSLTFLQR